MTKDDNSKESTVYFYGKPLEDMTRDEVNDLVIALSKAIEQIHQQRERDIEAMFKLI
jgi:hypothetical protein